MMTAKEAYKAAIKYIEAETDIEITRCEEFSVCFVFVTNLIGANEPTPGDFPITVNKQTGDVNYQFYFGDGPLPEEAYGELIGTYNVSDLKTYEDV